MASLPAYVLEYAPVVYLHSKETYFPSDLQTHLDNLIPKNANFKEIPGQTPLTLDNLDKLNAFGSKDTLFLSSKEDVTKNPKYLNGVAPDAQGKTNGAKSCVIILNDRGSGRTGVMRLS